ncbi:MAG TPA: ADP-glyceromanno-heptose 6-epimerase [Bacteroidetes bacterium]|nr:ADP-glyceromanno-heptose 6-epimerase [Bacteroidota bacterium]
MAIIVTGAAGFIGSGMISYLNEQYENRDIIAVDDFSRADKNRNLERKVIKEFINRVSFIFDKNFDFDNVELIIHLGARTDTTEMNKGIFDKLNLNYSKSIWKIAAESNIPLIYASSAATYGAGELGYADDESKITELKPLNPYGESKNEFDKWVLQQEIKPPFWVGLKFFNVFGPNEYHKGRMSSVIFHAYNQIKATGKMKLFKSHKPEYKNGEQQRDFIYVKDIFKVIDFLIKNQNKVKSGIYNLGTGKARSFNDLAMSVFYAMNKSPKIEYIDTPIDIRDKYQYFTQADMDKLRRQGYLDSFYSLEKGVIEYVRNYLVEGRYL